MNRTVFPDENTEQVNKEQRSLESVIQPMLLWGVIISSALMLFGILLGLVLNRPIPETIPAFTAIIPDLLALQPAGFLAVGLLVLIATPILRVVASVIGFLIERDWRFALITFAVFLVVLVSIFLGRE